MVPALLIRWIDLEHLLDHQRRQAERRLVQQQHLGPAHQRAADRHHLLLAAGQRAGRIVALLAQDREQREDLVEQLLGCRFGRARCT